MLYYPYLNPISMIQEQIQKQLSALLSLFLVIVTIFFIALTASVVHKMNNPAPSEHFITVSGTGKAIATPDLATISFGVRSEGETTEEAQSLNTETTNNLLEALRNAGIANEDLQTANYSLRENTVWNPDTGEQESRGWIVSQMLQIKVRESNNVGNVLSLASRYGVTDVNGPEFQRDDLSRYESEARMNAIAAAQEEAALIAEQLGVTLGDVTGYNEWMNAGDQPFYRELAAVESLSFSDAQPPELAPGQEEVEMEVSITYSIQ